MRWLASNRGFVSGRMVLSGAGRWVGLDVADVLDVAEALLVEEIRHTAALGVASKPLESPDLRVPFATRYGLTGLQLAPRVVVDDGSWEEGGWEPSDDAVLAEAL